MSTNLIVSTVKVELVIWLFQYFGECLNCFELIQAAFRSKEALILEHIHHMLWRVCLMYICFKVKLIFNLEILD